MITTRMAVGLVAANFVMGMSMAVGGLELPTGVHVIGAAHADPSPASCQEDNKCWVCATMGDWVCGLGNDNGLPAGCYGTERQPDGGNAVVLKEPWPCYTLDWPNGDRHIYRGYHDPLLPTQITTVIGPAIDAPPNPPRMGGEVGR